MPELHGQLPLPGMAAAPASLDAGAAGDREIHPSSRQSGTAVHSNRAGSPQASQADVFLRVRPRQHAKFSLLVMTAASVAEFGCVAHLANSEGMVAVTHDDGRFTVTEESLEPPRWLPRVREILDRL